MKKNALLFVSFIISMSFTAVISCNSNAITQDKHITANTPASSTSAIDGAWELVWAKYNDRLADITKQPQFKMFSISYWPGSHTGGFLPYFAMGTNKAALEAMCRYFEVAFAPMGITVNAVCAGITDDSIVNSLPKEAQEAMLSRLRQGWNPMGRPGTPADIGGAIAALCTEDAGWITGQIIVADGGALLMNPEVPLNFQHP